MIGAIEGQKVEGVLHMHMFLYFQMQHQYMTLHEISERLMAGLGSTMHEMKEYVNNNRRASYPDLKQFTETQQWLESQWPNYPSEMALCKPPYLAYFDFEHCSANSVSEAATWSEAYDQRLQSVMARMTTFILKMSRQENVSR